MTKNQQKKIFKCEECKNIFPILKVDQLNNLREARKYINCKIVCGRCYAKIRYKNRLGLSKTPKMPIWVRGLNIK